MKKVCKKLIEITGWLLSSISIAILFSGCASIGKGVVEAILEKSDNEDTRQCQVWGKPFTGIEADLAKPPGKQRYCLFMV